MEEKDSETHIFGSDTLAQPSATGPLCMVFSSYSPLEAHLVSGMLEDNGILCSFGNEYIALMESPISDVTGGVKLFVQESDVARAKELLENISS